MSELPFRRIVLLCDAASNIRLAVADAAALAARLGVALHGVFLDDENLHRLAELPFGQQVSLSCASCSEELTAGDLASLSSALGAGMRRAIAQVAAEQGLEWTFGSIRDLPSAAALVAEQGDILVVEGATRAFSGTWRPRSAWEKNPGAFAGSVLVRGRRVGGKGILLFLPNGISGREKVLSTSAALAAGDEEIIVVGNTAGPNNTAQAIANYFGANQRSRLRTVPLSKDGSALIRSIAALNPAVVVLDANDASPPILSELLAEARRDILLVR